MFEVTTSTISYGSTRGGERGASFEDVVLSGLAHDRGLYVPETLPTVSPEELLEVLSCTYTLIRIPVPHRTDKHREEKFKVVWQRML